MRYRLTIIFLFWGCVLYAGGCVPTSMPPNPGDPVGSDVDTNAYGADRLKPQEAAAFERDRRAILRLAGNYAVSYRHAETIALRAGYDPATPYEAEATERVLVVEEDGRRIVLQHLLLIGDPVIVVKHWRQDWSYRPATLLRYVAPQTWNIEDSDATDGSGVWVRSIYEADGSPAYAAWGVWAHDGGLSSWSAASAVLAPLPRRETHRRADYQVLQVLDRVTLTPGGWSQEQAATKRDFSEETEPLVRESGVVNYRRSTGTEFSAAEAYWSQYQAFWQEARGSWRTLLRQHGAVAISEQVEGVPLWRRIFDLAEDAALGQLAIDEARPAVDRLLAIYLESVP